jgi:hypothetical protein
VTITPPRTKVVSQPNAAQTPSEPSNALLNREEASAATGLTIHTLDQSRQLRKRGVVRGPDFLQNGRSILYSRAAIDAWLKSAPGKTGPKPSAQG